MSTIRKTKAIADCEAKMVTAVYPQPISREAEWVKVKLNDLVRHYFGVGKVTCVEWDEDAQEFYFDVEHSWTIPTSADDSMRGYHTTTKVCCTIKPVLGDLLTQLQLNDDKVAAMIEACNKTARRAYAALVAAEAKP